MFVNSKLTGGDLYWVNSRNDTTQEVEATFRVSGKVPRIWHPETGRTESASYTIENGLTKVDLVLTPNDAVFVVFQQPAIKTSVTVARRTEKTIKMIEGPWNVAFQPNRGAPASTTFDKLTSYTENSETGIKYFSGTATYTKTVQVPGDALKKGVQAWLDLGDVNNLAEVRINGKPLGVIWKKPFRLDITNAIKAGNNRVEIRVTNLWVNRLIGDAQPGVTNRFTYTAMPFYQANSKLLSSGLLGPVKILSIQ